MPDGGKPVLVIKDLDRATFDLLVTRAASHGRTVEEEATALVRQSLAPPPLRLKGGLTSMTREEYDAAWDRFISTSDQLRKESEGKDLGPPSEVLIREMRDRGYGGSAD